MDKPVLKQVSETKFSFCVKFYTPDPGQLEEEFTRSNSFTRIIGKLFIDPHLLIFRYQFALQIKRDLQSGTLLCSDNTAALLASYIVQGKKKFDEKKNRPTIQTIDVFSFQRKLVTIWNPITIIRVIYLDGNFFLIKRTNMKYGLWIFTRITCKCWNIL